MHTRTRATGPSSPNGSRKKLLAALLAVPAVVASHPSPARAGNLYWDPNGATAGAGPLPSGTWGVSAFWSTDPNGAAATGAWVSGSTAVFSAGSDATGSYGILVSGTQTVGGLTFEDGTTSLINGTISLGAAGTTAEVDAASATITSVIAGTGSLVKTGTGTLVLTSASSSWSGTANQLSDGTLSIPTTSYLGATPATATPAYLTISNGATLRITGTGSGFTAQQANKGITLGTGGGTIEIATTALSDSAIFLGTINGSSATLTKTGAGEMRVQGANTFQKLVVSQGMYRLGNAGIETGLGAVPAAFLADQITLQSGAWLGSSNTLSFNANRGITLGTGGGGFDLSAGSITVPGVITGSGALKTGVFNTALSANATLVLSGNNTYTGNTNLNGGTLALTANGTLGDGTGAVVFNGGTLQFNADHSAKTLSNAISLSASGTIQSSGGLTSGTWVAPFAGSVSGSAGTLTIRNAGSGGTFGLRLTGGGFSTGRAIAIGASGDAGASQLQVWNDTAAGNITLTGAVSGAGSLQRTSASDGGGADLVLGGNNTYSGGTTLNGGFIGFGSNTAIGTGTLSIGKDSSVGFFAAGGSRAVANAVTFTNSGASTVTIRGSDALTMSGAVNLGGATRTFLVTSSAATTLAGKLSGGGGVTKAGTGTLTLSNAANAYTGNTTVSGGTLALSATSNNVASSPAVTVGSGATLDVSGVSGFALASGQTLAGSGTVSGDVTAGAGSNVAPTGTLTFSNNLTIAPGSTLAIGLVGNSADFVSVGGTANVGGALNIATTGAQTQGKYKILGSTGGVSGQFASVTGPAGYSVRYLANEVDLQHNATIGAVTAAAGYDVIVGGTTTITGTVANAAPTDSADLNFMAAGSSAGGTFGGTDGGTAVAGGTAGTYSLSFTPTTAGNAVAGAVNISDPNATNSPQSANFTVRVLDHAQASVGPTDFGKVIRGSTPLTQAVQLGNASAAALADRASLQIMGLGSGLSGPAAGTLVAAGDSVTLNASVDASQADASYSQTYHVTLADDQAYAGKGATGATDTTFVVTGQVLNHAGGQFSIPAPDPSPAYPADSTYAPATADKTVGSDGKTLNVNFKTVYGTPNADPYPVYAYFDIANVADVAAGLHLDHVEVSETDPAGTHPTWELQNADGSALSFADIVSGAAAHARVAFNSNDPSLSLPNAPFAVQWKLYFTDEAGIGGGYYDHNGADASYVLTINGTAVAVPLPAGASMGLGLLGALGAVRRLRKNRD